MCIPKSEDHSLEIAFAGKKKITYCSISSLFENAIHTYHVFAQIHPILSPPVPPYPPDCFSPKLHVLFFFPLGLLSAACVRTGEGPCSRSRGRSLGARMLEES